MMCGREDIISKLWSRGKNEVRDIIDGDQRLTVRGVTEKCGVSKTTLHDILFHD